MTTVRFGCHLSLGRRPRLSIQEAHAHGAEAIQVFASSPGAWKAPVVDRPHIEQSRQARIEFGVDPLVIHAIYLINLASENPEFLARSRASLIATLQAGVQWGALALITHIGSHSGRGFDAVSGQIAEGLVEVLEGAPTGVLLLLENSAGAGGIVGSTLDELARLLDLAGRPPRLGVTLDTAHLCGAGWDFREEDTAERLVAEIDRTVGLDRLAVIHANDSKVAPGTHRDRHAVVGEGHIGLEGFEHLLAQEELRAVPWILETPDLDSSLPPEERFVSIAALRSLAGYDTPRTTYAQRDESLGGGLQG
jgi:deoxyribonuclease-4